MKTILKSLAVLLIVFCGSNLFGQSQNYIAFFDNTEQTVYRDNKDRLVMSYKIEGPQTEAEIESLKRLYLLYNMFEEFEIKPTGEPNVWEIHEITKPAVKIKEHRKLFVVAGIYTVFVDNEPYPVEGFRMKMLKNKN
ncbi:MAG TPA: hypothetical protein PKY63_00695 [Bacteroidales bacterium]|nr:hypothetical protein [Bacteroidales bacterium]